MGMSIFPSGKIVPGWECQFFLQEKSFLDGIGPNRNVNLVMSLYYYRIIMYNNKMARRRSFIKRTNKKNRTRNRTNKKNRTRNRINKKNRTKRINQKGGAFNLTLINRRPTQNGHTHGVNSVAFHPMAPLLATGSDDTTAKLWSFSPDGSPATTCVATLRGHSNCVRSVAFHPTAPLLATGSSDRTAKLWRFSPDGPTAPICVPTLAGHTDWVTSVAFHPTAPLLATGSADNTAKLWRFSLDGSTATFVATLAGHAASVNSVAFHPTEPLLATGSSDSTAKLWRFSPDGSTATCVATLVGHAGGVNSVAFHPTEPLLATGSSDATMKLWKLSERSPQPDAHPNPLFSANAEEPPEVNNPLFIVVSQSGGVVRSVAFDPKNGSLLATVDNRYTVKLWQLTSDHQSAIYVNTLENGGANSIAFHPTRPLLATGTYLTDAKLYNYEELPPAPDTLSLCQSNPYPS
jgi:WD40 repeat protein